MRDHGSIALYMTVLPDVRVEAQGMLVLKQTNEGMRMRPVS